jgi:hypothetical protein
MVYEVCDSITSKSLGLISISEDLKPVIDAFCSLSGSIYLVPSDKIDSAVHIRTLDAFLNWLKSVN